MSPPHAIPVWIKVSSNPEVTGMKSVTEEERADGILRLEPGGLVLEVEVTHSTTTVGGMGHSTDVDSLGLLEVEIPFDELVSARLHGRWWRPRIRIQTSSLRSIEGLPGAKRGVIALRLSYQSWRAARTLLAELEFARADLELRRATRLEGADPAAITPGPGEIGS